MEKTIFFNDFCANKECEEYIAWNYDGGGCEYPINCESCKLVGQSHDITVYPKNCLFLNDIQKYEREQKQALNIAFVMQGEADPLPSDDEVKLKDNGFGSLTNALNKLKGNGA